MDAISEAWEFVRSRPKLLLPWIATYGILILAWTLFLFPGSEPRVEIGKGQLIGLGVVLSLIWLALWAWASAATVLAVEAKTTGKESGFGHILREALARTPALFLLYLLMFGFVGVAVALPLLITYLLFRGILPLLILAWIGIGLVWGAIVLVRVLLAEAALLVDRMGIVEAIGSSWEAAKGRFWSLLGLLILFALAELVFTLLGYIPYLGWLLELVGGTLAACLLTAALAFIYLSLGETKLAATTQQGVFSPANSQGTEDQSRA